jgi:hypothetical protein
MNQDVIYLIFSFLIQSNSCIKDQYPNLRLVSKNINNFFKINSCSRLIKYNNKIWCSNHNCYEYKLSYYISKNKVFNENLTFHIDSKDKNDYKIKDIYDKVTYNDYKIGFSHICCSGNGIVFKFLPK